MKRPWNLIDTPVYSLATMHNGQANMNICTYVTAVSMQPKMYAIAVYHGSLSLQYMQQSTQAVLQLLQHDQYGIVPALGKKSGHIYNKINYLTKKNMLTSWEQHSVLTHAAAYLLLTINSCHTTGDHDLYTCTVTKYKSHPQPQPLTFQQLITRKIILG